LVSVRFIRFRFPPHLPRCFVSSWPCSELRGTIVIDYYLIITKSMEQSNIFSDGVIPSFVTCVLCLDDVDVNNPDVYVDACPDDSHPGFHKECLLQYIDSKVKMGK